MTNNTKAGELYMCRIRYALYDNTHGVNKWFNVDKNDVVMTTRTDNSPYRSCWPHLDFVYFLHKAKNDDRPKVRRVEYEKFKGCFYKVL